jgi:3,4-dihydroxy 2-butanone 4-phosphate synthase
MTQLQTPVDQLDFALQALGQGGIVLVHDSLARENEVDMVVAAELISPDHVETMRSGAGGLLCLALGYEVCERFGIATMRDILLFASHRYPVLKLLDEEDAPYGGKSAFSITVNHRQTFTGVTDRDRALTMRELAKTARMAVNGKGSPELFASEFKAPGHVHLLQESKGSLSERRGHTELSVYMCRLAGLAPAAAICEMLDADTHNALSIHEAQEYAHEHSIPLVDGQQLVSHFLEHNNILRFRRANR